MSIQSKKNSQKKFISRVRQSTKFFIYFERGEISNFLHENLKKKINAYYQ